MTPAEPFTGRTVRACPYLARAWWGNQLLAESTRALRVDRPDRPAELWFPWRDVRHDPLLSAGTEAWDDGAVESFDAAGPAPRRRDEATWSSAPSGANEIRDGAGVVRRCLAAPRGLEPLRGHAVIDAARARLELVDSSGGEDPHDVAISRFPNWGDAADLIEVVGSGAVVHDSVRPVVEGSQLLGQAIAAAMRQVPDRRVVSAHMVFLRAADANQPIECALDTVTNGRTFTALTARAEQGSRLCATGTMLLSAPAEDVVRHFAPLEEVPGPYDAVPYDMGVTGRDLRVVAAVYTDDPDAPVGPPSIDAWLRFRQVPDDPAIHAGLLAQFTGHMSLAAALRPHEGVGQREAHRSLSMAINAISISFHADVRMDRWVLYRHLATVVADGMAHSECRVYDEAGCLLASFTVDAMIRALNRSSADPHVAL